MTMTNICKPLITDRIEDMILGAFGDFAPPRPCTTSFGILTPKR